MLLENTCINIIGTIQPDVLISLASKHTDNGLLDRFLYTRTERDIHVLSLDDVDDSITEYYNNVINEFNTYFDYYKSGDEYILTMTSSQMEIYRHYDQLIVDMQKSDEETYQLASYLSKARTYFPRFVLLCAVLNMIEGNELQITDNCIHNAWKITDYFTRSARDLFSETVTKNEIMEIKSTLKGKTTPEKIRELIRKGLNNTQIAHELGISKQYIGKVIGKK
jgi:FixJ family two-component response regulator